MWITDIKIWRKDKTKNSTSAHAETEKNSSTQQSTAMSTTNQTPENDWWHSTGHNSQGLSDQCDPLSRPVINKNPAKGKNRILGSDRRTPLLWALFKPSISKSKTLMQNPCGRQGRFDAYSSQGTSTNIYKEPSERHVAEVKYMLSGRFL